MADLASALSLLMLALVSAAACSVLAMLASSFWPTVRSSARPQALRANAATAAITSVFRGDEAFMVMCFQGRVAGRSVVGRWMR